MSESEIKEAAESYSPYGSLEPIGSSNRELFETRKNHFIAGAKFMREHADKEAYNRGWNESIEKAIKVVNGDSELHWPRPQLIIEELQKLRK